MKPPASDPEKDAMPEVFTERRDRNMLGFLASAPNDVTYTNKDGIRSSASRASANYGALRNQAADAMRKPDAAVCMVDTGSYEEKIIVANGSSARENAEVAQKIADDRRFPGRKDCGPAKDFLRP